MISGDILEIVEADDGSGWTKVSRSGIIGLVPTSYIESVSTLKTEIAPAVEKGSEPHSYSHISSGKTTASLLNI